MSEKTPKLFLLDAFALIYRSYFAFINNPRVSSKGLDTSAIFGFTTTLLEVLEKQNPSHIAVVYDTSAPTVRHIEYTDYKANRDETPEAIKISVPYIRAILEAMNIPFIGVDGYEADDVIGTLAWQASDKGFDVYMMTPDKDFGQLVRENVWMYRPGRSGNPAEVWGIEEIKTKFGIDKVEQVVDYLGMMGDAVDNIPGFPGVGPKTAQKLLAEYGSMENMLENVGDIKGKLGEKIRENKEQGLLSKKLAKILTDAPVEFKAEEFKSEEADLNKVQEIFETLEFRTLMKRVMKSHSSGGDIVLKEPENKSAEAPSQPLNGQTDLFGAYINSNEELVSAKADLSSADHWYQLVEHIEARKLLLENLLKQKVVCFDTETTGLDTKVAELIGIAFTYEANKAYYLSIPEGQSEEILEEFRPFFENEGIEKVGQNIKYDISVLKSHSVEVKGPLFDTMLAHYLIQPDMRHNMDVLAETYLNYTPKSIESLIGKKGKNQKSMREVAVQDVAEYAGEDSDITFRLYEVFKAELEKNQLSKVFKEIEMPLVPVLADMETEGIMLDVEALYKLSVELEKDIADISARIIEIAGKEFNISSPKQLGLVLFEDLQLSEKAKKTKTGQYSTSEDVLVELKEHEIVAKVLEYRQLVKLKSTYVDALPTLVSEKTNRIHTSFNQAVAATGRLSSNNPNLQNIPIRTKRGQEVRKAFIPRDKDHLILAADYSQIELRLIAELSGDKFMSEAFINGEDIHAATAAKVFNVPLEKVTREQRSNAKTVNFGIIYGVSAFGLSQQTDLSRKEASEIIKSYFQTYPGIRDYIENQKEVAREQGYVETMMGRRRYLKDINSKNAMVRTHAERNAVNAPIQGSAADIIKIAMIKLFDKIQEKPMKSKMLLQVHDELVFDAHKDELAELEEMIRESMENAVETKIPLIAEFGQGANWLEAH